MEILMGRKRKGKAVLAMALLVIPVLSGCRETSRDSADVRNLIWTTWNRPGAEVHVDPIAVSGDHAVADWTQAEMGGRALLVREDRKWRVMLCASDALRDAKKLKEFGVPSIDSGVIAGELAKMEADVPAKKLKAMSAFKGLMRM